MAKQVRTLRMIKQVCTLHRWLIYRIGGTPAQFVGLVHAPDKEAAIKQAIREFEIKKPEQRRRLMAVREREV
jgi:1,2-phenylacetyl-CoA epoxidase PaaB subunit